MSEHERSARTLTRSLMLGLSLGAVTIVQVGCTQVGIGGPDQATVAQLCQRALQTRQAADVEALLRAAPRAECVAPTLAAMPQSTMAQVSPRLLAQLPTATVRQLPEQIAAQVDRSARERRSDSDDGDARGGRDERDDPGGY